MTDEVFNRLRKFESYFVMAIKTNSILGMSLVDVEELSSSASEIGLTYNNNHCPKCLLDFCKKVGAAYFEKIRQDYGNEKTKGVGDSQKKTSTSNNKRRKESGSNAGNS